MKYLLLVVLPFFIPYLLKSQTSFCGVNQLPADPAAQALQKQLDRQAYEYFITHPQAVPDGPSSVLTVAVVVHIIHDNGAENISDAQVQQGIAWLNAAYSNAGYFNQGSGTDAGIQFCLAQLTPDSLPTNGITRDQSALTNMTQETQDLQLKELRRWQPKDYLNIWLVREICSTAAGCGVVAYAYPPSLHGTQLDGLVIEAQFFGNVQSQTSVAAHELGHYFGLYHTFEGKCTNDDCLHDGDRVCDTPPDQSTAAVPCGQTANTCSTDTQSGFTTDQPDMTSNFLDYGDINCLHDFTPGQAERMNFYLTGVRHSLLNSKGCASPCEAPVVSYFTANATTIGAGQTVTFTNASQNADTYQWLVNGTPFSTGTNPTYTFAAPGTYTVTLIAQANSFSCGPGTSEIVIHVVCTVLPTVQAQVCPQQSFMFNNIALPADTTVVFYLAGTPCDSLVTVEVSAFPPIFLSLPVDTALFSGSSIVLPATVSGSGPWSYSWIPGTDLSCDDCPQPIASPLDTITYTLTVADAHGCTVRDSITLRVNNDCQLMIPNAFTPNGDATNDWFYPITNSCIQKIHLWRVVNRWGKVVFERRNFEPNEENLGWDGQGQSGDVFVWMAEVEYFDGRVEQRRGEIMLLR